MSLGDDLKSHVVQILRETWTTRRGRVVPEPEDLGLGNDAVILDGVVLYADLDDSTDLVNKAKPEFAAEIYKSYLACAARIIRAEGASVTGYDGDRIMAVFIGDDKNSTAARAGLKINYAVLKIINPAVRSQYPKSRYEVQHHVGIDSCELFCGPYWDQGANDLVWVGKAANYAAKLSAWSGPATQITSDVYNRLDDGSKYGPNRQNMWVPQTAREISGGTIYTSSWQWSV